MVRCWVHHSKGVQTLGLFIVIISSLIFSISYSQVRWGVHFQRRSSISSVGSTLSKAFPFIINIFLYCFVLSSDPFFCMGFLMVSGTNFVPAFYWLLYSFMVRCGVHHSKDVLLFCFFSIYFFNSFYMLSCCQLFVILFSYLFTCTSFYNLFFDSFSLFLFFIYFMLFHFVWFI
jgi:hypothetical protein